MPYKTIKVAGSAVLTLKKSRFIATLSPVSSADEAVDFVNSVKTRYWDARRNVYAYSIKDGAKRYSDDGEPQGTAGLPALDVLERRGLVNVVVVVTRYFGGILLGAPGLLRAYSHAASMAVDASEIVLMQEYLVFKLDIPYSRLSNIEKLVIYSSGQIQKAEYQENVSLEVVIPRDGADAFFESLKEMTGDQVKPEIINEIFM